MPLQWLCQNCRSLGATLFLCRVRIRDVHQGSGKLKRLFKENHIELVLIDGPVTPVQQRNLEKAWSVKILDRTGLILEIFSDRAATREGDIGSAFHAPCATKGNPLSVVLGETQIEADRRAIDLQLSKLRQQLSKVVKNACLTSRLSRKRYLSNCRAGGIHKCWEIDIVQYSDRGGCGQKDMLFATLDPA